MVQHLTPLAVVETLLGPISHIAEICGLSSKAPFHWKRGSKLNSAGDIPSARLMRRLLDHSDARGLGLTAEHLIRGAGRSEIEAILSERRTPAPGIQGHVRAYNPSAKVAAE